MSNTLTKQNKRHNRVEVDTEFKQQSKRMKYNPHITNFVSTISNIQPDEKLKFINYTVNPSIDFFIRIMNSIKPNRTQKYLEFADNKVNPFQFPNKRIYIRDCYKEMFRNICKYISIRSSGSSIIIEGQPGIGKTSFIYVLLYFLKCNLSYNFNEKEQKALKKRELEKQKKRINKHKNEIDENEKTNINNRLRIIKEEINEIGECEDVDEKQLKTGFNYYILEIKKKAKKIEEEKLKNKLIKEGKTEEEAKRIAKAEVEAKEIAGDTFLKIYVVKGKKNGNANETDTYIYIKDKIYKSDIEKDNIENSLIIVDTYNHDFHPTNTVISISAPDEEINNIYKKKPERIDFYFDSFNDNEIKEWFNECSGFEVDSNDFVKNSSNDVIDEDNKFSNICKRYGNVARQIYYHYLYKENYNRDYWSYYKELIESVVGTVGYNDFIVNYMKQSKLEKNQFSNILMKYDMKLVWNKAIGEFIIQPKEKLKFISEYIGRYVTYKFYPPKDDIEYNSVKKSRKSIDDLYMKRMALRQIASYRLSKNEIIINGTDPNFILNSDLQIPVHHPKFILNSNLQTPANHPNFKSHSVYYILNEENLFDLIMEGVFIKILYKNEVFDDKNPETIEQIKKSIQEYSKNKIGTFFYTKIKESDVESQNITLNCKDIAIEIPLATPRQQQQSPLQPLQSQPLEVEVDVENDINNKKVFVDSSKLYYMRDCYYKIFEYVCPNNFNYVMQKNYLIFGHAGIGKSVLGNAIREYIHIKYKDDINIIHKRLNGDEIQYYNDYNSVHRTKPYIVISDEVVIGEDDYADAKMIILIADPFNNTSKTFQSKRFPLKMYIPPFNEREIEEVKILNNPQFDGSKELYMNYFINKNDIKTKECYNFKINNYETIKEKFDILFSFYGGIIGDFNITKELIEENIIQIGNDRNMIEELNRGIIKSSLSKEKYSYLLIYDTDENDITKSSHLRFISNEIQKMVYDKYYLINNKADCKNMIEILIKNPTGGLAGYLYEKVILFFMKKSVYFRKIILDKILSYISGIIDAKCDEKCDELKDRFVSILKEENIHFPKIQSDNDLEFIIRHFKDYCDIDDIHFMDLSYNPNFLDIDALFGPFGIQITISNSHTYAPEMTLILQKLFRLFTEEYDDSIFKDNTTDTTARATLNIKKIRKGSIDFPFGLIVISPELDVSLKEVSNRSIGRYTKFFQDLDLSNASDYCFTEVENNKLNIQFTYLELFANLNTIN